MARLIRRVEKLESEPQEPENESDRVDLRHGGFGMSDTLSEGEQWASEQLWAFVVAKATSTAYKIIVGLDNAVRSRGVRAWFKLSLEATGTRSMQVHDVTESSMPRTSNESFHRMSSLRSKALTTVSRVHGCHRQGG